MRARRQPSLLYRRRVGNEFDMFRCYLAIIGDGGALRCRAITDDPLTLTAQSLESLHQAGARIFAGCFELGVGLGSVEPERCLLGQLLVHVLRNFSAAFRRKRVAHGSTMGDL